VGLLKKYYGETPTGSGVLPPICHGRACLEPAEVSKCRVAHGHREVLVCWIGQSAAEATWMLFDEFRVTYPAFQLRDDLCLQGGRDVMWGIQYRRRAKQGKFKKEIDRIKFVKELYLM
jgi:hypothetical protein